MKKKVIVAITLGCILAALVGCGSDNEKETTTQKRTETTTQTQKKDGVVDDIIDDVETGASSIGEDINRSIRNNR